MFLRILPGVVCLTAMIASGAHAQGPAPSVNSAPVDHPAVDGTAKAPDTATTIPDVVKPASGHGDVLQPKTAQDPAAVIKPPDVDPGMTVARPVIPDPDKQAREKDRPK